MIVSDTEKFIFVHIPKCAGTSIRSCLLHYDTTFNFFSGMKELNGQKLPLMHLHLRKLEEHFPLFIDSKMRKYYTFAIVRNPYTRAVSSFNSAFEKVFIQYKETNRKDSYREMLNNVVENLDVADLDSYAFRHFIPQNWFVYLRNENLINTVLRFEELPSCIDSMKWMHPVLAYRIQANLKNLNARYVGENTIELLSDKAIQTINKVYEKDFSYFKYSMLNK